MGTRKVTGMFTGRRLALTLAFTVFIAVAFGASCQGFFVAPTLTSITINPTAPSVQVGQTTTLSAFGVNSNQQGMNLTSGVSWSTSDATIATITGSGSAILTGVASGNVTVTASAQSVTNSASATVFITVSSMTIKPSSQSITGLGGTTPLPFIVTVNGSTDVSSSATLTAFQNGTQVTGVNCSFAITGPTGGGQGIYCSGDNSEAPGTYQLVATYTGTTITANATLTITN
jgi:Bacterial Ig-like domain (group 2)